MGFKESERNSVSKQIGEYVFYLDEVKKILHNLGGGPNIFLKDARKELESYMSEINGKNYYPKTKVWEYLQKLEDVGKIKMKVRGMGSIDDVIAGGYHKIELSNTPGGSNRVAPKGVVGAGSNYHDNIAKIAEGK
jgi:hypothetical protein